MPQKLRLNLLGEPQIYLGDALLTGFISSKSQALLIYLAATGRANARDKLATLLWDEMPDAAARKNLTKALSNIRKLTGDLLETDNQAASLDPNQKPVVDLHSFEETVTKAVTSAPDDPTPNEINIAELQEALTLYQGDFLAAFHVKDAPLFEEWVWSERERLHDLAVQGLLHVAEYLRQEEKQGEAISYLRRLLEMDPIHEEAHLLLIQALAETGQRSAALTQYEQCRQILAEELGVDPSTELQALHERLLKIGAPQPHNIPTLAPIVGRDVESEEIHFLLTEPGCRLLTIAGPGGIGKTRLAYHVASNFVQTADCNPIDTTYPDGVYFVALAPVSTIDGLIAAIADALHFAFRESEALWEQLSSFLQRKEMLLVLDNFEQLLQHSHDETNRGQGQECVTFLTTLFEKAPNLKIIATSRTRLGIQSEHIFHLGGMEYPKVDAANLAPHAPTQEAHMPPSEVETSMAAEESTIDLPVYGAVQLFAQNACRLRPDFTLTSENYPAVAAICHQVGGMPLGILLATSWITVLSPAEILAEISTSPDMLETQESDVPTRQRSIRAAFDYTWQMLSKREREIYKKLSVFRGDFTRQAAQHVAGASLRELMSMVDKSLITPAQDGRFSLHGLLRQFGIEKLEEEQDLTHFVCEQHCRFFAEIMAERALAFKGADQVTALHETEIDSEDIRAAWQWAVQNLQIESLSQFIDGLCQFYAWRGRFQEGETVAHRSGEVFQVCLETSELPVVANRSSSEDKRKPALKNWDENQPDRLWLESLIAKSLTWHGEFARLLGRTGYALELLEESLERLSAAESAYESTFAESTSAESTSAESSELDLRAERAFALLHMGEALREDDKEAAQQNFELSLEQYRAANDQWGTANALAALGWVVQHWGNYDVARQIYQDGLSIRKALRDRRGEAESLRAVGGVALYQGDLTQAAKLIEESIDIAEELEDQVGRAAGFGKTGEILIALGRFSEAQQPLAQSKALFWDLGMMAQAAFIDAIRGLAYLHLGFYDLAKNEVESALQFFRDEHSQRGIAYGSLVLGWVLLAHEATDAAKVALEEAVTIYKALKQRDELGQAHALLGLVEYQHGDDSAAEAHLQEANTIAEEIHAFMPHVLSLAVTIWHAGRTLEQPRGNLHCSRFGHQPIVASSRWFTELLGEEE